MDQWSYRPDNTPEQPQEPVGVPAEQPAAAPVEQPAEQPTEQPPHPQYAPPPSYNPYGWNQAPYSPQPPVAPKPPKKSRTGLVLGIIGGVCALVIVALSVLLVLSQSGFDFDLPEFGAPSQGTNNQGNPNAPTLEITELDEDTQGLSTRDIVKRNIDSTVLLTIFDTVSNDYGNGFPFSQNGQEVEAGSATGIVMTADGYIITNWHCVVNESTGKPVPRVDVKLYDGTVYERATLIGADQSTDLAVIKVNATGLQAAEFGDSNNLQLGDKVVALGNAGGLGWSATQGIVSGLARDVYEDTGYAIKCLQVDAAINPGNSGGPLFNAVGQVIAVNSAKIVAQGYEGLGFSIPINEAKAIIDELISNGYISGRVALGITGQTYSDAYYSGFLIYTIEKGSPLEKTAVRKGDLITAVDGQTVEDYAQLRSALAKHKVGDTVTLTLLRSSNRKVESFTVKVTLIESKQ